MFGQALDCGAAIGGAVVSGGVGTGGAVGKCANWPPEVRGTLRYIPPFTAVRAPCLLRQG